jgi:Domain of unknown function (DUF3387)
VAVRDLVDDAVASEGVVDIFKSAGIEKADISILDDKFLQTFKDQKHENLRLKLLKQLLLDEIHRRQKQNLVKARSFRELLEKTLQRYHSRIIDVAAVVQEMIKMRQEMEASDVRAKQLGLADDELAFYDAISDNYETVYERQFLRDLVHEVVQTIKKSLKVDWIEPHRDDVRAAIRAAVRRVLSPKEREGAGFRALHGEVHGPGRGAIRRMAAGGVNVTPCFPSGNTLCCRHRPSIRFGSGPSIQLGFVTLAARPDGGHLQEEGSQSRNSFYRRKRRDAASGHFRRRGHRRCGCDKQRHGGNRRGPRNSCGAGGKNRVAPSRTIVLPWQIILGSTRPVSG